MQPIERYGLITLLFLVVSAVAFAMWDAEGEPREPESVRVGAGTPARGPELARANLGAPSGRPAPGSATLAKAAPTSRPASAAEQREARELLDAQGAPSKAGDRPRGAGARWSEETASPNSAVASRAGGLAAARPVDLEGDRPARTQRTADENRSERRGDLRDGARGPSQRQQNQGDDAPAGRDPLLADAVDTAARGAQPAVGETYTVGAGEVLGVISQKLYGTTKAMGLIAAANPGINVDRIYAGQKLRLPSQAEVRANQLERALASSESAPASEAPPAGAAQPEVALPADGVRYRVRSGDSLWRIAAQQLGDGNRHKEIAALNPAVDPDRLVLGTLLVLPGAEAVPIAPVASNPTPAGGDGPRVR